VKLIANPCGVYPRLGHHHHPFRLISEKTTYHAQESQLLTIIANFTFFTLRSAYLVRYSPVLAAAECNAGAVM
jgi:hypothetical protein